MPDIVSKTIHVRFSTQQRATLADQMADVQSQIDGVEDEKKKAMAKFNDRLKALRLRMHEFATAVREGEGDIVVECMWKPDANKPLEHLWRLDTMEIVESRALTGKAAEKAAEAERQLDLVTPTPAGAGDGRAVAAGGTPGERPAREAAKVLRLRVGPMPPCPAPVPGAPGGICGADGDPEFFDGFCQQHNAALPEAERAAILEGIAEVRRQMKTQEAAERRAKEQRIATAAEEDAARDAAHKAADEASGQGLDAIGGPLGCARQTQKALDVTQGETVDVREPDDEYRVRVKVAIDQAHKAATARASTKPTAAPEVTGQGAVPPIVREKPREVTADLVAQLAAAAREAAGVVTVDAPPVEVTGDTAPLLSKVTGDATQPRWDSLPADGGVLTPEKMAEGAGALIEEHRRLDAQHLAALGLPPDALTAPADETPPPIKVIGDAVAKEISVGDRVLAEGGIYECTASCVSGAAEFPPDFDDDAGPAPGNEAELPPSPDEVIDGPQPLYNRRRPDGWPLCPECGEDELSSASVPPREATIVRCDACGWRPPIEETPAAPPPARAKAPRHARQVLHIGDVEIDTTGLPNHEQLLRVGPCEHMASGACVEHTRLAVEEARGADTAKGIVDKAIREIPGLAASLGPPAEIPEWCAALRRQVTKEERESKTAVCACGKPLNIRPVPEDGAYVATLPKHKRQVPA